MPTKKVLQEKLEQLEETNKLLKDVIIRQNKRIARLECLLENDIDPKFYEEEEESDSSFIVSDDENC